MCLSFFYLSSIIIMLHYEYTLYPELSCLFFLSSRHETLKSGLVNDDIAHGTQPLSTFLLLLEQFSSSRHISSVELGKHILTERFDGLSGHDTVARCSLNDNLCKQSLVICGKYCALLSRWRYSRAIRSTTYRNVVYQHVP